MGARMLAAASALRLARPQVGQHAGGQASGGARTSPPSVSSIARYSWPARTSPWRSSVVRWWMLRLRVDSSALDADQGGEVVGAAARRPTARARRPRRPARRRHATGQHARAPAASCSASARSCGSTASRSAALEAAGGAEASRLGSTHRQAPDRAATARADQRRHADALRLRTRHQRGLQAAHVDRDEVMDEGVMSRANLDEARSVFDNWRHAAYLCTHQCIQYWPRSRSQDR